MMAGELHDAGEPIFTEQPIQSLFLGKGIGLALEGTCRQVSAKIESCSILMKNFFKCKNHKKLSSAKMTDTIGSLFTRT